MADASCEQCGLARPAGAATCPRCGWEYAASAAGDAQALVLRAAGGQALAGEWRIEAGQTTLGRSHTADVVLTHDSVSRQHARIVREAEGFVVEDLGSHNWTLVNGERITAPRLIADGDQITVGEVALEASLEVIAAIELLPAGSTGGGGSATMLIDLEDEPAAAAVPPPIDLAPAQEQPTTRPRRARRGDNGHEAAAAAPTPQAEDTAGAEPAPSPSEIAGGIAHSATELAATLGRLEQQLATAAAALEAAGGRPVLAELLEQARQTAASPTDVRALMALGEKAQAAANLLALELQLVDVLWPSAGAAGDNER